MSTARSDWAQALKLGLIGGICSVFIALVGMVEAFATRDIVGGVIDMGHILVLITFFLTGHFVMQRVHAATPRAGVAILQAALAGLINAALLVLLVLLLVALPAMRNIFVNATPTLLKLLTFDQVVAAGIGILLVLGAGLGALPGLLRFLPEAWRRSLIGATSLVIIIGLLQELLTVTFQNWTALKGVTSTVFAPSGLSVVGAAALFIAVLAINVFRLERGKDLQSRFQSLPATQRQILTGSGWLLVIAMLLALPSILGLFFSEVLVQVGLYALMGLGLNIVVGFAGLLDLGYVAFFAIGAYTVAILTSTSTEIVYHGGFPFWTGLPVAIVTCIFAGIVLGVPVLKVRGDYLAIVTLGFGEIIRLLALSEFLKPYFGGSRGVELIPKPYLGTFEFATPKELYYLILAGCLLVALIATRLKDSRIGRAWIAMREDEDVAQSMGINLVATKLLAFGMGASFAGVAGAINASKLAIIYPHSFNLLVSINVLALIILGGMGSIPGVIVGALALVGLPELFREFSDFRLMVYGAVLVLMMLVRPEGLWPESRRRMELEEAREEAETEPALVGASGK